MRKAGVLTTRHEPRPGTIIVSSDWPCRLAQPLLLEKRARLRTGPSLPRHVVDARIGWVFPTPPRTPTGRGEALDGLAHASLHSSTIVSVADLTHSNLPVHNKPSCAKKETHPGGRHEISNKFELEKALVRRLMFATRDENAFQIFIAQPMKRSSLLKKSPMDEYTWQSRYHLRSDFARQGENDEVTWAFSTGWVVISTLPFAEMPVLRHRIVKTTTRNFVIYISVSHLFSPLTILGWWTSHCFN